MIAITTNNSINVNPRVRVFIGSTPEEEKELEYAIPEGISFFDNANLSEEVANFIKSNKNQNVLYKMISSTALDKEGIAVNNSLRQIEVCVPFQIFREQTYCISIVQQQGREGQVSQQSDKLAQSELPSTQRCPNTMQGHCRSTN